MFRENLSVPYSRVKQPKKKSHVLENIFFHYEGQPSFWELSNVILSLTCNSFKTTFYSFDRTLAAVSWLKSMKRQIHRADYFPCGLYWDPNKYKHFNSILRFNRRSDSKPFPVRLSSKNYACTRASVIFLPCFVKAPPVFFFCILLGTGAKNRHVFFSRFFFLGKFLTWHFYF